MHRRALLRGGALGLATAPAPAPPVAGAAGARSGAPRLGMGAGLLGRKRIEAAIATITCDGFGDEDFKHAFATIPRIGVKNVEFNCWYARNLTPAGLESIKARCRRAGLVPISIQGNAFVAGEGHDLAREVHRLLWLIESCRRLGCRIIKCTGAGRGTRGGLEGLRKLLAEVAPAAEEAGVLLCLENHHKNNLELPEDYDRIFDGVLSPAVGMCLDPAHFNASGVDLHALVERFAARIYHVDLKDNAGPGAHNAVPFGTGAVKLEDMVAQLVETGYRGYLVVELAKADRSVRVEDLIAGYKLARTFER
jgi:sugar phosphate isomerase/epimerase